MEIVNKIKSLTKDELVVFLVDLVFDLIDIILSIYWHSSFNEVNISEVLGNWVWCFFLLIKVEMFVKSDRSMTATENSLQKPHNFINALNNGNIFIN